MASKQFSFTKLYFSILAIVGIVGAVVGYGIALYQGAKLVIITDDEYIQGSYRNYEITQCEQPIYKTVETPEGSLSQHTERTPEEIASCKEKNEQLLLANRRYEAKDTIIGGLVRGTLFLIVFITHYPRMLKHDKQ